MVHRSTPQQTLAERYFPVRVRVAVPETGFGAQLNHMQAWLDEHAGMDGYFTGAQTLVGMQDAMLVYFVDAKVAAEFCERFGCRLLVGTEGPRSRDPRIRRA